MCLVDTVFEALVSDKSFIEACNFLRSNAIQHDQKNMGKAARQIHSTDQLPGISKKDKVKQTSQRYKDRLLSKEEITSLEQCCLTQGDAP